jgi:GT2 family glycosyltransferase
MAKVNERHRAGDAMPAVALVVLNYQRRALLLDCLAAASASTHARVHVVVVDNGSSDGSADAVEREFPEATVIRSPDNKGVAGGRNLGARWVLENLGAEFLVFIDNDTMLEPEAVGELARAAGEDATIGLVAPKAFRRKGDRRLLSAGGLRFNPYTGSIGDLASGELDDGRFDDPRDIQACPGFAFLVRREVFARIGFFDEHFNPYGWEDGDFSLRAGRAGYRLVYAPRAVVYHLGGRIGRGAVTEYEYHKARSMLYFMRRHTTRVQWLCFLLLLPCRVLLRVVTELAHGRFSVVGAWLGSLKSSKKRAEDKV